MTDGRTDSSSRFDPQRIQKTRNVIKRENARNMLLESLDFEGRKIFWVSPTGGAGFAKGATATSSYRMDQSIWITVIVQSVNSQGPPAGASVGIAFTASWWVTGETQPLSDEVWEIPPKSKKLLLRIAPPIINSMEV